MCRIFAIILFLGFLSCTDEKPCNYWKVIEAEGNNPFMENVSELCFNETEIIMIYSGNLKKFPVLISGNKMVIVHDQEKMLVQLEYIGDTLLQISELYQKYPLRLKLKKTNLTPKNQ
jgi:hypothetical protein